MIELIAMVLGCIVVASWTVLPRLHIASLAAVATTNYYTESVWNPQDMIDVAFSQMDHVADGHPFADVLAAAGSRSGVLMMTSHPGLFPRLPAKADKQAVGAVIASADDATYPIVGHGLLRPIACRNWTQYPGFPAGCGRIRPFGADARSITIKA